MNIRHERDEMFNVTYNFSRVGTVHAFLPRCGSKSIVSGTMCFESTLTFAQVKQDYIVKTLLSDISCYLNTCIIPLTNTHLRIRHDIPPQQFYLPNSSCFQAHLGWGMFDHQSHKLDPGWLLLPWDTHTVPCHQQLYTDGMDGYTVQVHRKDL